MAQFEDLVMKLVKDKAFADRFHNKSTRADALKSIGVNPDQPGLKDALDKIDYDAIHKLRTVLEPATPATVRPFN